DGRVDADLGRDAADDQVLDPAVGEDGVQVGGEERALARLVAYRLVVLRRERRDQVVALLAADQDAPHRSGVADAHAGRATFDLRGRRVGQGGPVALARVGHSQYHT